MGYTCIEEWIGNLYRPLKEHVGDLKVKGLPDSPANSNMTNGKQTYTDVVQCVSARTHPLGNF